MLNTYEQRLVAFYLANAAAALHHRDREASDLAEWIADRENRMAFGSRKRRWPLRAGKVGRDEGMSGGQMARSPGSSVRGVLGRPEGTGRTGPPSGCAVSRGQPASRARTSTSSTSSFATRRSPVIESMIDDVFRSSRMIHAAQRPESGVARAPWRLGEHRPGPLARGRATCPVGARLHRQ